MDNLDLKACFVVDREGGDVGYLILNTFFLLLNRQISLLTFLNLQSEILTSRFLEFFGPLLSSFLQDIEHLIRGVEIENVGMLI